MREEFTEENFTNQMLERLTTASLSTDIADVVSDEEMLRFMDIYNRIVDIFIQENLTILEGLKIVSAIGDAISFLYMQYGDFKDN